MDTNNSPTQLVLIHRHKSNSTRLRVLRSGDPNTAFHDWNPSEILDAFGPPNYLLSTSTKSKKCQSVGVLARVLYFTPGIFCPDATDGCLAACLGHSSGRMGMPTHAACRDKRAALYLEEPTGFMYRLRGELAALQSEASRLNFRPAARLNGSSDLPWETLHADLFREFPHVAFFDYTKNLARMTRFLRDDSWPENYHLTFSASTQNHDDARQILQSGGNVAVVFWPNVPNSWWGYPVIDGDTHDARFLDTKGSIVGLRAKGRAQGDRSGFTIRTDALSSIEYVERSSRRELSVELARQAG